MKIKKEKKKKKTYEEKKCCLRRAQLSVRPSFVQHLSPVLETKIK